MFQGWQCPTARRLFTRLPEQTLPHQSQSGILSECFDGTSDLHTGKEEKYKNLPVFFCRFWWQTAWLPTKRRSFVYGRKMSFYQRTPFLVYLPPPVDWPTIMMCCLSWRTVCMIRAKRYDMCQSVCSVDWLIKELNSDWLIDWSIDWLIELIFHWARVRLIDWLWLISSKTLHVDCCFFYFFSTEKSTNFSDRTAKVGIAVPRI